MNNKKFFSVILFLWLCCFAVSAQMHQPVTWDVKMEITGKNEAEIVFDATIERGWHLYDINIPAGGPNPTAVKWDNGKMRNVEIVGGLVANRKAVEDIDFTFNMMLGTWEKSVTLRQKVKLLNANDYAVEGVISGQACNEQNCQLTKKEFAFAKSNPVVAVDDNKGEDLEVIEAGVPESHSETVVKEKSDYWNPVKKVDVVQDEDTSLLYIFLGGFLGGLLALLTPCVWPMIPLTVSFFLKKSDSKSKAIINALIYGVSIIVIYLLLGLIITLAFGPSTLNELATGAVFNVFFFVLLVFFAISFFGAFEITMPSKWTNAVSGKAGKTTGLFSLFFMAFTLVLVSFSCTGPIIGTLLVEAVSQGNIIGPAIGMFGFALALAVPFALFAMFPSVLKGLPKSGGWLSTVKVVLGFIELALSLKFLSVADLAYGWHILDREVFISLWIVIFALLGLYLLKVFRFSGEDDDKGIGAFRLILATISLSFAMYLVPGLWGAPLKSISAFAPPLSTQDFNLYESGKFQEYDDFDKGMDAAKEAGKPVFLDFSGYGCVNCRKMEAAVFDNQRIRSLIEENFVMITLMADDKRELPEILEINTDNGVEKMRTYGDLWSYLQRHKFGANSQPYYVVLDNEGNLLSGPAYYDENVDNFAKFLNVGIKNYKKSNDE
ncbi:MAG: thioredoxin family protein [Muribaculaceae bacterium]|nr:thioredoxin family protein [Muribaculaceae bacterium]MDD6869101.1 cytochrome c biogenesis protein CcdA [bacterium]